MRSLGVLIAAALISMPLACAPTVEHAKAGTPAPRGTQLVVDNNNWLDVAVYLVRGSARTRVGTVRSMSKGQFTIPDTYIVGVSDITVQADPIGSTNSYVSPPIVIFAGARVNLQVSNAISQSGFAVYAGGTPRF